MIDTIVKCVLIAIIVIGGISYEIWNQKKNRDAEWYFKDFRIKNEDFRNKVLAYMVELRTEPEYTRRMLRKLAFDDLETKLKDAKQTATMKYNSEISKDYKEKDSKRICNLAGKIDGLDYALELLKASKPKSYREEEKETDPSMPKELQIVYNDSVKKMLNEFDKQLEMDKEWKDRKQGKKQ